VLILTPSDFSVAPASGPATLVDWVTSSDGQQVQEHGQCAASLLPRDDDVLLVLPPRAVSWHNVALPKVAATKLRAVLDGMLEDRVLSDTAELHYALQPGARGGQAIWVAACHKAWLQSWLRALEAAGRPVTRMVPALWPLSGQTPPASDAADSPPQSLHWAHDEAGLTWLSSASALGVSHLPLHEHSAGLGLDAALAAMLGHAPTASDSRWLADPSAAALAEQSLGQRFELMARPQWLLRCAATDWNLAQFDLSLSASARRGQRWRQQWRRLRTAPAWRSARWGLAALLVVQVLGLNAAAWLERDSLNAKQQALRKTLQQGFPDVGLVLDAPLQMRRELIRLQQASGSLSQRDLETMLNALSQAAPNDPLPQPSQIDFNAGEGRFSGWRAPEDQVRALERSLAQSGWRTRYDGNELTLQPPEP